VTTPLRSDRWSGHLYLGEFIPGHSLIKHNERFHIVENHSEISLFTWSIMPWPDPFYHLTDQEIDAMSTTEFNDRYIRWIEDADKFNSELDICQIHNGLIQARHVVELFFLAGYTFDEGELNLWAFHRIGEIIQSSGHLYHRFLYI
jgi:hypothetical protein